MKKNFTHSNGVMLLFAALAFSGFSSNAANPVSDDASAYKFEDYLTLQTVQNPAKYEWLTGADDDATKLALNANADPVVLYLNGGKIAELPPSSVTFIPAEEFPAWNMVIEGSLTITFADSSDAEAFAPFNQNGTYELVVPDGFITFDGNDLQGTTVTYVNEVSEGDVYTFNPSPEDVVSSLDEVTLNINNSEYMEFKQNYLDPVALATLKSEDGSVDITLTSRYASGANYGASVLFKFGEALAAQGGTWVDGKYTLTVLPDVIYPDGYNKDVTFGGCTVEYTMEYVAPVVYALADHVSRVAPASENVDWDSSEFLGMSRFVLGFDNAVIDVNRNGLEAIQLNRDDICIATVMPGDTDMVGFEFLPTEDDDVSGDDSFLVSLSDEADDDSDVVTTVTIIFSNPNWSDFEDFRMDGTYTLEIPDGAFTFNGESMVGTTITYIYSENTSAVALVGGEAAESYDVYTLDGKVVMVKAASSELSGLDEGLYIINGKKVYVRK